MGNRVNITHGRFFFLATVVHFQPCITLWVASKIIPIRPSILGLGWKLLFKLLNGTLTWCVRAMYLVLALYTYPSPSIVNKEFATIIRFCKTFWCRQSENQWNEWKISGETQGRACVLPQVTNFHNYLHAINQCIKKLSWDQQYVDWIESQTKNLNHIELVIVVPNICLVQHGIIDFTTLHRKKYTMSVWNPLSSEKLCQFELYLSDNNNMQLLVLDLPLAEHDIVFLRNLEAMHQEQLHPFLLRSLSFPPLHVCKMLPPLQPSWPL